MSRLFHDEQCDTGDPDVMCRTCRDDSVADDRQSRAESDR